MNVFFFFYFDFDIFCTYPVQQDAFDEGTWYGYDIYSLYSMYVHGAVCM